MDNQVVSYIAVDVSKETLRVQTDHKGFDVANSAQGMGILLRKTAKLPNRHFVCEATGGWERTLVGTLHRKKITVSLVSAAFVRNFARSEGVKAKSDPIDARVILRFAHEKRPVASPAPTPERRRLMDLLDRREQLSEHIKREKTRRQKPECSNEIEYSLDLMTSVMEEELERIEKLIETLVEKTEEVKAAKEVLLSIKGIGVVTAWTIIAYMPEIASANRVEIAALAGVAPFNCDSGKMKKTRRVFGGRAKVRRCLYMAALAAAKHNDVIRPYVAGLVARGKPKKCALVAAMRKLLIHAQRCLKKHEISLA
jgi:transposase